MRYYGNKRLNSEKLKINKNNQKAKIKSKSGPENRNCIGKFFKSNPHRYSFIAKHN